MYNSFNFSTFILFQKMFLLIYEPTNMWYLLKDKLRLDHGSMAWKVIQLYEFISGHLSIRNLDDIAEYEFISLEQAAYV